MSRGEEFEPRMDTDGHGLDPVWMRLKRADFIRVKFDTVEASGRVAKCSCWKADEGHTA